MTLCCQWLKTIACTVTIASLAGFTLLSADEPATPAAEKEKDEAETGAGHSLHGEAFDDGPRQQAYRMSGTGKVHFPCTCKTADVQAFIDQGVGQLHGFWYYEAERSFRQAARLDPDCAIAYWGMAMANVNNTKRAQGFIAEAVKRKAKATRREQRYIEALAAYYDIEGKKADPDKGRRQTLIERYEAIAVEFPEDIEARAFLAFQIYENHRKGITISSFLAADAIVQDVLDANPEHPAHHYRIHLWDTKGKPERALASAAKYGPAQPAIAHAWHMPGHIYSKLKRYHDAAWQQEASARVDHAHMMRDRVLPDQIHNFAHNNEWLIRNLIHIGRVHEALDLAKNMIDLPRHPVYNVPTKKGSAQFGRMRLFQILEEFELWNEVRELAETRYLEPTSQPEEQLKLQRLLARAAFRSGHIDDGTALLNQLREQQAQLEQQRTDEVERAVRILENVGRPQEEIEEAKRREAKEYDDRLKPLGKAIAELEGLEHLHHERWAEAMARLKEADGVPVSLTARLHLKLGETDKGLELLRKEVASNTGEVVPLTQQILLLWEAGRRDEARKAFESLRAISATIDRDIPFFAQLDLIAAELGWPGDWRQPLPEQTDLGERPPLDSLGPFRWSPSPAPVWTLQDQAGVPWSLEQYRGRPVVVLFYLGHGCVHCVEQLQTFAPAAEEFREAGIELIAISSDDLDGLKKSQSVLGTEEFPFPLVADAPLDVFRLYRCYDDFEQSPLHGTFLIDEQGLVRWQDISYEPFMHPDFLLAEARRLLSQGPVDPETSAATSRTLRRGSTEDRPDEGGEESP